MREAERPGIRKKKMESTSLGICSGNEHGLTKERDEHKGSGGQCAQPP